MISGTRFGAATLGALLVMAAGSCTFGSGSGLFVVDPDGGNRDRLISGCITAFSWSPDGQSLAFVRLIHDNERWDETGVIDLADHSIRILAKTGRPEPPSWSPNGSMIAYDADPNGTYSQLNGIYVTSTTGKGRPRRIDPYGYYPAWSPDGAQIAFNANPFYPGSQTELGRVATVMPSGDGLRYVTGPSGADDDVPVLWFGDGQRLLYVSAGEKGDSLMIASIRARKRRMVATGLAIWAYAVSRRDVIAYTEGPGRLHTVSDDSSGDRVIANGLVGGWSPDGNKLVFTSEGVYVTKADGSEERRVASGAGGAGVATGPIASWSSRGQIAYIDNSDSCGGSS